MEGETGNGGDTSAEEALPLDSRWYEKLELLIVNVNKVLRLHLCIWPVFEVSFGETMKKFKSR